MTKSRRVDLLALIIYIVLLIPAVLFFEVSFLIATILFFAVPTVYMVLRGPSLPWRRITYASLLTGFLLFQMDFLAEFNKAWIVPRLFFAEKIFGVISIDIIIWGFLWALFILVFYEHFLEHDVSDKISKNFKILGIASLVSFFVLLVKFFVSPSKIHMPYAYLILGAITLLIFLVVLIKLKKKKVLIHKFLLVGLFFAFVHLAHELTSLKLGLWYFPGQYVGNVNILGIIFPVEELFFWILISASILVAYYEFFVDDEK